MKKDEAWTEVQDMHEKHIRAVNEHIIDIQTIICVLIANDATTKDKFQTLRSQVKQIMENEWGEMPA